MSAHLTDAQRKELERRAVEDDANPDDVISWEEVRKRIAARLQLASFESETKMSTLQQLGIDRMSADERLRLIGEIWDSLSPADQVQLPDEQHAELDRRIAAADADPSAEIQWEVVKERSRSRK